MKIYWDTFVYNVVNIRMCCCFNKTTRLCTSLSFYNNEWFQECLDWQNKFSCKYFILPVELVSVLHVPVMSRSKRVINDAKCAKITSHPMLICYKKQNKKINIYTPQAGPRGVLACRCDMLKFWRDILKNCDMLRDILKKLKFVRNAVGVPWILMIVEVHCRPTLYYTCYVLCGLKCFRVSLHTMEQPTERHARISGCGPPCTLQKK